MVPVRAGVWSATSTVALLDSTPLTSVPSLPMTARTLKSYSFELSRPVTVCAAVVAPLPVMAVHVVLVVRPFSFCRYPQPPTPAIAVHDRWATPLPGAPVSVVASGATLMVKVVLSDSVTPSSPPDSVAV